MTLEECLKKKKRSLTAIYTLELSTVPISMLWGSSDITKGTSFRQGEAGNAIGFVFKLAFFLLIAIPWMVISFVYNLCNYFYLNSFEKKLRGNI